MFGEGVGITESFAIVSAYGEDDAGGTTSGKAYIFDNAISQSLNTNDSVEFVDVNFTGTLLESGVPFVGGAARNVSNIVAVGDESGVFSQPATTTNINNVDVWVNGIKLVRTAEYTSDGTDVTITSPAIVVDDDIEIITWE